MIENIEISGSDMIVTRREPSEFGTASVQHYFKRKEEESNTFIYNGKTTPEGADVYPVREVPERLKKKIEERKDVGIENPEHPIWAGHCSVCEFLKAVQAPEDEETTVREYCEICDEEQEIRIVKSRVTVNRG